MRRGNIAGGISAYDKFTGEDTPIKDYLSEALRGAPSDQASAVPVIDKSTYPESADAGGGVAAFPMGAEPPISSGALPPTATGLPLGFDASTGAVDPALMQGAAPTADATAEALRGMDFASAGNVPLGFDAATGAVDPALMQGAVPGVEDAATPGGVPILSALKGADQLAQGDVLGAAGTGGKAWLASLGPYGIAAAMALGLFGG
jgi:hypothetical protein